ncbi:PepSY domain-containing protein [Ferrimonas balearica]|uniref:PepSY domain-containing protein n=1 Tax=Ferrimonas balearica TaxID=44012 RepID=UPI001C98E552|nr:PepSY domain-containing protein [Ferrimonas balearica]MBY5922744.1 PepSY domain-containing protein [Ferrimonas balearica]MBY5995728.1 PepSY domain-containing protein [Ferrimonas balearica]
MKYLTWLPLILAITLPAQASSRLYEQLVNNDAPTPLQILKQVEQRYQNEGRIVEFELEVERGVLTYEVSLGQSDENSFLELTLDAYGNVLERERESGEVDDESDLEALAALEEKNWKVSDLVEKAIGKHSGFLLEAQLEHNIGISYLEVELLTEKGKRKLAVDLATGEPLPILQWD